MTQTQYLNTTYEMVLSLNTSYEMCCSCVQVRDVMGAHYFDLECVVSDVM
jgi:hypothetical protein